MKPAAVWWLVVALASAGAASAQDRVYRCGADGRVYSHSPCPAGQPVDVADARTPQQLREAQAVVARDIQRADALAQERRQRERAASRQGAAHIGSSRSASAPDTASRAKAPRKPEPRRSRDDNGMTPPLRTLTARS